jgi:hypothetical protein
MVAFVAVAASLWMVEDHLHHGASSEFAYWLVKGPTDLQIEA